MFSQQIGLNSARYDKKSSNIGTNSPLEDAIISVSYIASQSLHSTSHFFRDEILTSQFASEFCLSFVTAMVGGALGRRVGALCANQALAFGARAMVTHLGMSRSSEIIQSLIHHRSVDWQHLLRFDKQDVLGTFSVGAGEILGGRAEAYLANRSWFTRKVGGCVAGGSTMQITTILQLSLGVLLGWTTADELLSQLSLKAFAKSCITDAGFRAGHGVMGMLAHHSSSGGPDIQRMKRNIDLEIPATNHLNALVNEVRVLVQDLEACVKGNCFPDLQMATAGAEFIISAPDVIMMKSTGGGQQEELGVLE